MLSKQINKVKSASPSKLPGNKSEIIKFVSKTNAKILDKLNANLNEGKGLT
jgi:hypothetical protein